MVAPQFHHTSAVAHGNSGSFSSSSLCIRAAAVGNGSCRSSSGEFPESRGCGFKHCNCDNEKCLKKCSRVYQLYYIPKIIQEGFPFTFWILVIQLLFIIQLHAQRHSAVHQHCHQRLLACTTTPSCVVGYVAHVALVKIFAGPGKGPRHLRQGGQDEERIKSKEFR